MRKYFRQVLIFAAFLALLDQTSKYLVQKYLQIPFQISGDILKLEYSENTGIAFGIPVPYYALILLTLILIVIILYIAKKDINLSTKISKISIGLIIGGAFGNLIDRVRSGFVIDFIAIWKWPNFNLADIYIAVGILLLLGFYGKIKQTKKS